MRLVSLAVGLAVIVVLMQTVQSDMMREKLARLFGDTPPATPAVTLTEAGEPAIAAPLPGVDAELLESVEDNTPFRDSETEAWFHLIEVARDTPADELAAASRGAIVYSQLLSQPSVYRGQVISITGRVHRIEQLTPAANDLGIDHYYRLIVQSDRDVTRPFQLYCLELPAGWSVEGEIPNHGEMRVEALFFKNWPHTTGVADELSLSPTFVSRTIAPIVVVAPVEVEKPTWPAWQLLAVAMVIAALAVAWISTNRSAPDRSRYREDSADVVAGLESLADTAPVADSKASDEVQADELQADGEDSQR
ncbi:hypothetical protein Pan181_14760 [Aeoliella mucimassa]|uniref:Uncharacterized protein n=2 Tax=Aeoliella mucimassa TaxID=2527972 RepID=A0A518AKN0_9BACT|nr:hypothetical protein Pan181_14760 [Aeoliella mucimassa]